MYVLYICFTSMLKYFLFLSFFSIRNIYFLHLNRLQYDITFKLQNIRTSKKKNCKRSESSRGKKSSIGKIVKNDSYLKYFHFHPTVYM